MRRRATRNPKISPRGPPRLPASCESRAAWLGLVPAQNSTGGKTSLGAITKAGDRYLRQLLVNAGTGFVRRVKADANVSPWIAGLLQRMPAKQAAVAIAIKLARIAWAILVSGGTYKAAALAGATA